MVIIIIIMIIIIIIIISITGPAASLFLVIATSPAEETMRLAAPAQIERIKFSAVEVETVHPGVEQAGRGRVIGTDTCAADRRAELVWVALRESVSVEGGGGGSGGGGGISQVGAVLGQITVQETHLKHSAVK